MTESLKTAETTDINADRQAKIAELLNAAYPVTLGTAAKMLGTTEIEAARALPEGMAQFVTGGMPERFDEVWARLAAWEKVTLFVIHDGHVFEVEGKLGLGKRARGYYNILGGKTPIGGHLAFERIAAVAFVTLPFMKSESLSVQFFNTEGAVSFAVYVGRENHQLIESVKAAFFADREALTK